MPRLLPVTEITPNRVRVAREGVNVLNPPTDTPQHLAFSTDWPKIERVHTRAVFRSTSLLSKPEIPFAALAEPPFGLLLMRKMVSTVADTKRPVFYDMHAHTSNPFPADPNADYLYDKYRIAWITRDRAQLEQHIKIRWVDTSGPGVKEVREPDTSKSFDFIFLAIRP